MACSRPGVAAPWTTALCASTTTADGPVVAGLPGLRHWPRQVELLDHYPFRNG